MRRSMGASQWRSSWRVLVLGVLLGWGGAPGCQCGPEYEEPDILCTGDCSVSCPNGDDNGCSFGCQGATCVFDCPNGKCGVQCSEGANCDVRCPGGQCGLTCDGASSCTMDCAGNQCGIECI